MSHNTSGHEYSAVFFFLPLFIYLFIYLLQGTKTAYRLKIHRKHNIISTIVSLKAYIVHNISNYLNTNWEEKKIQQLPRLPNKAPNIHANSYQH
jgi:hypothetical protein